MARDYSQFLPDTAKETGAVRALSTLETLGWRPIFAQQMSADEMAATPPVRIVAVHRNGLQILGEGIDTTIPPIDDATVGDWLKLDRAQPKSSRILERKSLFQRRAPGMDRHVQLIAANVDSAFIVTSCNQDFNVARLERYIALAFEAEVTPVIVLTKADLCETPQDYVEQAQAISTRAPVLVLDARGDEPQSKLAEWCKPGQTLAFLGSSGVGKSTLVNALTGTQSVEIQPIREDDSKGRHTTTRRELHILPGGFSVLDTPGMRELQLTDAAAGVADVFSDLHALSSKCRFNDCQHSTEPGCAVLAAVESGDIDRARLGRWKKLVAEERHNSASLAERRSKDKQLGKTIRAIQKAHRK